MGDPFFIIPKSHFDNAIFFHWGKNGVSICVLDLVSSQFLEQIQYVYGLSMEQLILAKSSD